LPQQDRQTGDNCGLQVKLDRDPRQFQCMTEASPLHVVQAPSGPVMFFDYQADDPSVDVGTSSLDAFPVPLRGSPCRMPFLNNSPPLQAMRATAEADRLPAAPCRAVRL
jgi:hypothetical protein